MSNLIHLIAFKSSWPFETQFKALEWVENNKKMSFVLLMVMKNAALNLNVASKHSISRRMGSRLEHAKENFSFSIARIITPRMLSISVI